MVAASADALWLFAGAVGKAYRIHRRHLPMEIAGHTGVLLCALRERLLPPDDVPVQDKLASSRSEVRALAQLLETLASRPLPQRCATSSTTSSSLPVQLSLSQALGMDDAPQHAAGAEDYLEELHRLETVARSPSLCGSGSVDASDPEMPALEPVVAKPPSESGSWWSDRDSDIIVLSGSSHCPRAHGEMSICDFSLVARDVRARLPCTSTLFDFPPYGPLLDADAIIFVSEAGVAVVAHSIMGGTGFDGPEILDDFDEKAAVCSRCGVPYSFDDWVAACLNPEAAMDDGYELCPFCVLSDRLL